MRAAAAVATSVVTGRLKTHSSGVQVSVAIRAAAAVLAGPILLLALLLTRRAIKRAMELLLFMPRSRARSMLLATSRFTAIRPTTF